MKRGVGLWVLFLGSLSCILSICLALYTGKIWFNMPGLKTYPIQGLDVSAHQGAIDWEKVPQTYRFVYIKATEGGDFTDTRFLENWEKSKKAGFSRGAYHFFTLCRPGIEQAKHFLATVPRDKEALPPVVDLEFGGNCSQRPSTDDLLPEIRIFLERLEYYYQKKPILYVTETFFKRHLRGQFLEHPIWYRDILRPPILPDRRPWTFWQYSNRKQVSGIQGPVDANAFIGDQKTFEKFYLNPIQDPKTP